MKKLNEIDCRQALKMSHILFFSGFLLVIAGGLVLCVSTAPRALAALLMAGGAVLLIAGLILAAWKVRCPHYGASLMLGGRLPLSLPPHCPGCGEKL